MSKTIESLTVGKDVNQSKTVITNNINLNQKDNNPPPSVYIPQNPYENATAQIYTPPEFLEKLTKIVVQLLTIQDLKLIGQLVDLSGKIIFNVDELRELISLFLGCPIHDITINLMPYEPHGCFGKVSPYRFIENIKIQQRDFKLLFNMHYNYLKDEFKISLEKVLTL